MDAAPPYAYYHKFCRCFLSADTALTFGEKPCPVPCGSSPFYTGNIGEDLHWGGHVGEWDPRETHSYYTSTGPGSTSASFCMPGACYLIDRHLYALFLTDYIKSF